jgi:hypothetical protein
MENHPDSNGDIHHRPEYVILEPEEGAQKKKEESEDLIKKLRALGSKQFPWSIRLSILIVFLFLTLFTIIPLLYFVASLAGSTLTLFQSSTLKRHLKKSWSMFVTTLVVLLGFAVALFSPAFGFSIILLYTMLHPGEHANRYTSYFFRAGF